MNEGQFKVIVDLLTRIADSLDKIGPSSRLPQMDPKAVGKLPTRPGKPPTMKKRTTKAQ